jgi:endonuclease-3 related protein
MALRTEKLYNLLLDHFGHLHWWPVDERYHRTHESDPRFEIIMGAILTQNTAWSNVEKALGRLKEHRALTVESIAHMDLATLKTLIQPSGFFNQKAQRLKTISLYLLQEYRANLSLFFSRDASTIRKELLGLDGIGPETADSIVLYAGDKPVFVIDAYTRRISRRIPLPVPTESYDELQRFFEHTLQHNHPTDHLVQVYKELHALIVELAKNYCRTSPRCDDCPLTRSCQKAL